MIFIFVSLLLIPLIELYGLVQLCHLSLEKRGLVEGVSLHVVNEVVHDCLDCGCRGQVRTVDRLLDREGAAVGVCTDHIRFDRLVLSVDQDLLPRAEWGVVDIVATVDHKTVFIELLDLLNGCQLGGLFPVVLADQALADGQEGHIESVAELQRRGNLLHSFRVMDPLIRLTNLHFLTLCFYYK